MAYFVYYAHVYGESKILFVKRRVSFGNVKVFW